MISPVHLLLLHLHKSQGLRRRGMTRGDDEMRWNDWSVCVCVCVCGYCTYVRSGYGAESGIRTAHFDRQSPWAHWPPVMTAGQRQKRATALGASGFAYKMLLWPDLAFMGNPLNSDPFKLKWTFLAGAVAPRSQIICMV